MRAMQAAAAATALVIVATACPAADPAQRSPGERPIRGGTLRVGLAADPDGLDPHAAVRPSAWFVARAVHRGLMAFPSAADAATGARPVPDLAEAPPVRQGRSWRFTLRPDLAFRDGRALAARDVVASIDRSRATRRGVGRFFRGISATAPDARTVVIDGGGADLLWLLAQPQAAILPADTPPWGVDATQIVGAGPYKIERFEPGRRVTLVRNARWGEDDVRRAFVDRIELSVGRAGATARNAIAGGDLDLILDPGPPDQSVPAVPDQRVGIQVSSCVRYLFLNNAVAPFNSVTARRAVAMAIDRAKLPGVPEAAAPATGVLPPPVFGSSTVSLPAPNPKEAARAWKARPAVTLTVADAPRDRAEAAAIRRALARARIAVRVRTVAPALLYPDHYERGRTQMGIATWCAEWPGLAGRSALSPLVRSNASRATRLSGIRSKAIDAALSGARDAAGWRAADRAVVASAAIIPLTWPFEVSPLGARLRGWAASPMFPRGDPTALWLAR